MKKTANKIFSILLVLILSLTVACNKSNEQSKESQGESEPIEYFTYFNGGITGLTEEGQLQRTLTIPTEVGGKQVTYIGARAFEDCISLQEITLCEGITHIAENAFSGCSALSKINLPSTIEIINDEAFSLCLSLKEITLPTSLTLIDENAFYGCNSLEKIVYGGSYTAWQEIDIHQDWSLNANALTLVCNGVTYQYGMDGFQVVDIPQNQVPDVETEI